MSRPPSPVAGSASPWRIFAVVSTAVMVGTLNFSIVFVAFGEIEAEFDASRTAVSWVLTAYSITVAAVLVPAGWLADRIGRKRVFVAGVSLATVGSLAVALAPTVQLMIAARVLQAAGLGLQAPAGLALIMDAFPTDRRSSAIGAFGGLGGLAGALGPIIGGLVIDGIGWRGTFALNVPIGVAAVVLGARGLPRSEPRPGTGPPDGPSIAALVVGVAALALGITQSDEWGWADVRTDLVLVLAVAFLTLVFRRSRAHPSPILDLGLFRIPTFPKGNMLSFLIGGNFSATFLTFVTLLTGPWGMSVRTAGVTLALVTAIAGPMSFVSGRLADRFGHRAVIAPGTLLIAIGGIWFFVALSEQRDIVHLWIPAVSVYAVGVGLAHSAASSLAMHRVPEPQLGIAGGTNRIIQEVGNVAMVATVVALQASAGSAIEGVRRGMIVMIIVGVAGFVVALGVDTRPGRVTPRASTRSPRGRSATPSR